MRRLNVNNTNVALAALAAAVIGGAAIGFFARGETEPRSAVMEPVSGISAAASQVIKKPKYLLSQHEGKLAVYIIGKKEPELVFERYIHYLPDVDRLKLTEGIEIYEYSELLRLIEDYTG